MTRPTIQAEGRIIRGPDLKATLHREPFVEFVIQMDPRPTPYSKRAYRERVYVRLNGDVAIKKASTLKLGDRVYVSGEADKQMSTANDGRYYANIVIKATDYNLK